MDKDKYYFSHDHNVRNDKKISALVREFKSAGYGIFWATCEMMHEEGGQLEFDDLTIEAIAKDINEEPEFVKTVLEKCIEKFKLFTKQGILLQSNRVARNLESKNEKKNKKAEAGRLGGIKSGESRRNVNNNEAERSSASSNEPNESKVKESKGNEIKENESTMPLQENFLVPEMFKKFKNQLKDYPAFAENDFKPLFSIAKFLHSQLGLNGNPTLNQSQIVSEWQKICVVISEDNFYRTKTLSTISNQIQEIYQIHKNGTGKNKTSVKSAGGQLSGTNVIESDKPFNPAL